MRFSLSLKVFVLFSSLTAMTLCLSLISYSGYRQNQISNHRVLLFKDFMSHMDKLQVLTQGASHLPDSSHQAEFRQEFDRTRNIADAIVSQGEKFPPPLQKKLAGLPTLMTHFDRAFNELVDKYRIQKGLFNQNRALFDEIRKKSEETADIPFPAFYYLTSELWNVSAQILHTHELAQLPLAKHCRERFEKICPNPELQRSVDQVIQNLEISLITHLAVTNREAFLKSTSQNFFDLAQSAITEISQQSRIRQRHHYLLIASVCVLAMLLNGGYWFVVSRYFSRFIKAQKTAIKAIKETDYEYDFPAPSRDEIGDLSAAMKNLAQILVKNKDRYRNVIDQAADAVYVITMDGQVIDVNRQACISLGYSRQELLSMTVGQIDPMADQDRHKEVFWDTMVPGKTITVYGEHRTKSGRTFPVEVRIGQYATSEYDNIEGMVHIPEGKLMISFARDITERKQAEQALVESEKKYRSMMETMNDPVYIGASDLTITYMNPAMIRRIGRDATGEKCHQALHELPQRCPWCRYEEILFGHHYSMDIQSPKDNKTYLASSSPIAEKNGTVSKLSIYRDITELKRLEARIQNSQRMESIGTLAGGIAHDFNNILFPILGHTEMMLDDIPEDDPMTKHLEQVYQGALRAKDLVKQILTFSRQDTGELSLMKIQPVIKEALKLIRASIPATIEISVAISPDCGAVKADPTKLHQIIMNLCTNAYHAMEKTGGELRVALNQITVGPDDLFSASMTPGPYNCLSVSDTGMGMDVQLMRKIFDPYFTTKEKGKGTGMGLSVVHGIVKSMNGVINVKSEPGKGSRFNIYLPVVKDMFDNLPEKAPDPVPGGEEHILLVDDEKGVMDIVEEILRRLGYKVTGQTSSVETLAIFSRDPYKFDLVITDLAMPKMPGDRLAAELLKIRPDIPIILSTGFSEQLTEDAIRDLGIQGLLLKPVVKKELAELIRQIMDD